MALKKGEIAMNANTTAESPLAMRSPESLLPRIPGISFSMEQVGNLRIPVDLFDTKTPVDEDNYADELSPILVTPSAEPGFFLIIDGCKRVNRFLKEGRKQCPCGVFAERLNHVDAGLLRIFLNKKRQVPVRERVCFLRWLEKNIPEDSFELLAPLLGFSLSQRQELKDLLTCGVEVVDAVAQGRLTLRAVSDFCLLSKTEQMLFLNSFPAMALSQQTQLEFLQWLPEIAYERKTTLEALLQSDDVQKIVHGTTLNSPQKIEAIRALFFSWKFPQYAGALKDWKKIASSTTQAVLANQPSTRIEFIPNPAFEKNNLEIHLSIPHAQAAQEIFNRLAGVSKETWSRLIYPMSH